MSAKAVDAPSTLNAENVFVKDGRVVMKLSPDATVSVAIASLGEPWISASKKHAENVRLRFGGTWIFWDDLDEGIQLDEWLPYVLNLRPGALLGKRNRGKKASPKKARAARKNGAKGGRPKKKAA